MIKSLLIGLLLVVAAGSANVALGAAEQTSLFTSSIPNVQLPGRYYDLNQNFGDYAPGAALPLQACACHIYFTVIEGELTVTIGDKTAVYAAGKSGYVPAGVENQPINQGSANARVFYTMLKLADGTDNWRFTPVAGLAAPSLFPTFSGWSTVLGLHAETGTVTLIQNVTDWDAGFKSPLHVMNHEHVFSVLEGENTIRYQDGGVDKFVAGEKAVMTMGRPGTMENSGTTNNRMAISWVIASSAPPVSPVTSTGAISPPSTGDAGLASSGETTAVAGELAALFGGVAAAGLLLLAVRRRQSAGHQA
jgi:quercetin dioxygenase-like cupin family protein